MRPMRPILISANVLPSPASRWPSAIDLNATACGGLPASDSQAQCAVNRLGDWTLGVGALPQVKLVLEAVVFEATAL